MTTSWLVMPNGDAISNNVIKSVSLHNRGVVCKDAQQRIAAFIQVTDDQKGRAVRDILIKFAKEGRIAQPDWGFLQGDTKDDAGSASPGNAVRPNAVQ
jgi:hypothetical protein